MPRSGDSHVDSRTDDVEVTAPFGIAASLASMFPRSSAFAARISVHRGALSSLAPCVGRGRVTRVPRPKPLSAAGVAMRTLAMPLGIRHGYPVLP